jgi:hypothetical protein
MTNRILFLDIDGVLNCGEWMEQGHMKGPPDAQHFAPHLCARLERILVETGCSIVVSSAWRIMHSTGAIEAYLHERGASSARVIGETPRHGESPGGIIYGQRRGLEIQAWLNANPDPQHVFAIVDDSDDMDPVRHRLVRTSWSHGLQERDADQLIQLLQESAP